MEVDGGGQVSLFLREMVEMSNWCSRAAQQLMENNTYKDCMEHDASKEDGYLKRDV